MSQQMLASLMARAEAIGRVDVAMVEYSPETSRFGGPEALSAAETLFFESARCALHVLAGQAIHDNVPLGVAADHLLTGAIAFGGLQRARDISYQLGSAIQEHRPMIPEQSAVIDQTALKLVPRALAFATDGPSPALRPWFEACRTYRSALRSLRNRGVLDRPEETLFATQLHLMNNRFGLPWYDEVFLAHAVRRACKSAGEQRS